MLSVFTSREVYSQINVIHFYQSTNFSKMKNQSYWKEWDRKHTGLHVWPPIPDPSQHCTSKPCAHGGSLPLSQGMAIWTHNVGISEKSKSQKQTRNIHDTRWIEQENAECCWQRLQMTCLQHRWWFYIEIFSSVYTFFSMLISEAISSEQRWREL